MRAFLRWFWASAILTVTVLWPVIAWAQTPLPGQTPEENRPWTWYMSILIGVGAVGLFLLILFSYLRLSRGFYGKEEPPAQAQRPRYAAISAPTTASPSAAARPAAQPAAAPAQPAAAPAQPAAQPQPTAQPAPQEAPAQPAPQGAPAEAAPPAAPAKAAEKPAEVEPDQETFDRVLKEQLDAGTDRRVAEGRAKAAAIKAAREKSGG